jgi:phosphatidylinositol glycan class A protein
MLLLAEPEPSSIVASLEEAIAKVPYMSPWEIHENVRRFYSWDWVAERTERVYDRVVEAPSIALCDRLLEYSCVGNVYGLICLMLCALDWLLLQFLNRILPASRVDIAPDFPVEAYAQNRDKLAALEKDL